jgi:two-component system KDP operon response regulator KdpE
MIRSAMARVNLEKRGYIVEEAAGGAEAIENIKQNSPDLVILDLVMPDISGIDVCIWVRAQSDIPIIVLSAHDEEELKVRALDAGADDYMTKPFGYEELLARVRAVMRRAAGVSRRPKGAKSKSAGWCSIWQRAVSSSMA